MSDSVCRQANEEGVVWRSGSTAAMILLTAVALSACGGDDGGSGSATDGGSGSVTLSAADVEACFKDAGATVEHTNEASVEAQIEAFGFAQDFQGTLEGKKFDGFIEDDEDAISALREKIEELLASLTENPADQLVVANNAMIVFDATTDEAPDDELKSIAEDCISG